MITILFILSLIALIVLFTIFINKKPITYDYEYFTFKLDDLTYKSNKQPEWLPYNAEFLITKITKTIHAQPHNVILTSYKAQLLEEFDDDDVGGFCL